VSLLADFLSTLLERTYRRPKPQGQGHRDLKELACELVGSAGEAAGLALAQDILLGYEALDDTGKLALFRDIAREMNIDPRQVREAVDDYERAPSKESYRAFMSAAEPSRQELFRRLNQVPGATHTLVQLRADLLKLRKAEPELAALDLDLRHLFASWFNRGFLVLRPINWKSPAHILEKIISYEAVHAIDSWDDLRRRLKPSDRRCFAFFHPAMPDEPLIFVEVALTQGVPNSVQALLAEGRSALPAEQADTAVFYSISNCQAGLAGISFGNSLIKQVASDLSVEFPALTTFVTLSPVPGLTQWLAKEGHQWDIEQSDSMKSMAAHYLLNAKGKGGLPLDGVARFHLGNGAMLQAVHADADRSDKGRAQSGGVMVNYLYDFNKVDENHEKFASTRTIVASNDVGGLASSVSLLST